MNYKKTYCTTFSATKVFLLLFSLCFLLNFNVLAQQSKQEFGKNRVQYKQLDWKVITSKNFVIYYYVGGNNLAFNTARHLEANFQNVAHKVGYLPYDKINVFVYNCESDYEQSNVNLQYQVQAGGQTKLVKSKMEAIFKGSQEEYYKQLNQKLSALFIDIILYGGSFKNMVQSSYFIDFPDWLVGGAAEYVGYGATEEMYSAVQDFMYSGQKSPDRLTGDYAKKVGQSMFYYIEKNFGEYAFANILALSKSTRSYETGIRGSIGLNYKEFIKQWMRFYSEKIDEQNIDRKSIVRRTSNSAIYTQLKTSPDQQKIAYSINRKGIYYVLVKDLKTGKKSTIYFGGVKNTEWKSDPKVPLIAWKSNEELCLIKYKRGKPYLITKNIKKRLSKEKKLFVTFEAIHSFTFSPDQNEMALVGIKDGQSDVFTYNVRDDVARQITKDLYDEQSPIYSPDGKSIYFSSNRFNDTLRGDYGSYEQITPNFNLFRFDGSKYLSRITASSYNEVSCYFDSNNDLKILSTDGIMTQLFKYNEYEQICEKIDFFGKNIRFLAEANDKVYFIVHRKNKDFLLLTPKDSLKPNASKNYLTVKDFQPSQTISDEEKDYTELYLKDLIKINPYDIGYDSDPIQPKNSIKIDTNIAKPLRLSFPKDPTPQFAMDYLVTTLAFDPLRRFGAFTEVGGQDLLGNHRLSAKVFLDSRLKSNDFNLRYDYLKHEIDFSLLYRRDIYQRFTDLTIQKQSRNVWKGIISKPFSPVARLEFSPSFQQSSFIDYRRLGDRTSYNNLITNKLSFVYDNTYEKSLNQFHGFKMNLSIEKTSKISGNRNGFNKIHLDMRNYQDITRDIVWANRLSTGIMGGQEVPVYVLGGMDNWIGNSFENNEQLNPYFLLDDIENNYLFYSDFVTNMRGFGFNKMNGKKHILFNSEVRIPIVKVFYNGPINSIFFRNLLINVFYEAGSAWNGNSPFGRDNSINTRIIPPVNSPFSAVVTNFQNPFLQSYGFGMRSMLSGYYIKLDLAYGIQNYVRLKPKLHLSLGYDF